MIVRKAIQEIRGFRYMAEHLDIRSGLGQKVFYDLPWYGSREEIEGELERVSKTIRAIQEDGRRAEQVAARLGLVKDIRKSVERVKEGVVLDDLELFELKRLALNNGQLQELVKDWGVVCLPDLEGVLEVLDPEGTRIPHFYICDAFSKELAEVRAELKLCKQRGEEKEAELLYWKGMELEDRVRGELSKALQAFVPGLEQALSEIACLDLLQAKARQALDMGLVRPVCAEEVTVFEGLFNPQLQALLQKEGKEFQPVNLELYSCATVVTGANMAGKTVLLRTVGLVQCLFQFGFYVPARQARIVAVDEVKTSIGDDQDELSGLSSFAAEMLRIQDMVEVIRAGKRALVLVDELARTTNPLEGRAIVNGVVDFLTTHRTMSLVTTHYSGITASCRRLRVKGFVEGRQAGEVTWKNINEFIDYSLIEDTGEKAPHEALRIAALLGVDKELLEQAEKFTEPVE